MFLKLLIIFLENKITMKYSEHIIELVHLAFIIERFSTIY
jgi:hypothetical protein